jgi:tetratricopeptide (TPR) repeat protein
LIEAQDVFDKLVIDQPERPSNWHYAADTRVRIATIVTSDDRLKKAEELERRAVEIYEARDAKFQNFSAGSNERERVECYCGLAELLANSPLPSQRDPAHAVKLALKAVKMEPGEGASWTVLGMAHYRSGHWKDGLEALNKSVDLHTVEEIGSNDVFLAMTHWQMGDKAEALRCYDRAAPLLEKNASTHPYLKGLRAEAMELLGVK